MRHRRMRTGIVAVAALLGLLMAGCTGLPPEGPATGRAQLSAYGSHLAYVVDDARVIVRAVPEGDLVYRSPPREEHSDPALSADGRFVAYADEALLSWVDTDGQDRATLEVPGGVRDWALRPDGAVLLLSTMARLTADDDDTRLDVFRWTPTTGQVERLTRGDLTWGAGASFDGPDILFKGGTDPRGWDSGHWYRLDHRGESSRWTVPGLDWNTTFFLGAERLGGLWFLRDFGSLDQDWCEGSARLTVWDPATERGRCFRVDESLGGYGLSPCARAPHGTHVVFQLWDQDEGKTVELRLWDPHEDRFTSLTRFPEPLRLSADCTSGGGRVAYEEILENEDGVVVHVVDLDGRPMMTVGR